MKNSTSTGKQNMRPLTQYINDVQQLSPGKYLFRGQGHDFPLKPKIARLSPREGDLQETEKKMLLDMRRRAISWLNNGISTPQSDWDWLALAQHYGMATRLLDWSENALVALWFAVECEFYKKSNLVNDTPVVWAFKIEEEDIVKVNEVILGQKQALNPFSIDRTRVFRPSHISPRIIAQSGWFTVHKFYKPKDKTPRFIALEENKLYKQRLKKFKIAPEQVAELRASLRDCGFHRGSLFPGLEGVCRDITERHIQMEDELLVKKKLPTMDDAPTDEKSLSELVKELWRTTGKT